jgi:L-iditol 2-dehydrogenase
MRKVQLVAPQRLECNESPLPAAPRAGEILVKMHAIGLCGSDMHWYKEGGIGHGRAVYPMVLGHEPVGEIVELGSRVTHFRVGDRVSLEPSLTCGHCEWCLAGRHNLCASSVFMGSPHAEGFLRDYVSIPAHNADLVPVGLSWHEATLMEPVAVLVHVFELAPVRHGDIVAVLGTGSIGLITIAMARRAGAARIFAADRLGYRLEMARAMGAGVALNLREASFRDLVMDETRGRGADVVYDAAGAPETIDAGIAAARSGGRFVLIGIPSLLEFPIDIHTALNKELDLQMIKRSNHKGRQAGALLTSGLLPAPLITHTLPLNQAPRGFELLEHYAENAGKIVFDCTL